MGSTEEEMYINTAVSRRRDVLRCALHKPASDEIKDSRKCLIKWTELNYFGLFLDRPFCERSILCFAHVSFFSQLTFSDVCKPIFSKLFHMTWLYSKKMRCYADFLKVPPNKNEGRKPQISPNLASNRNILRAVTRNVEVKLKIENNSVHRWLLAYMFTKFGRGRLNSDVDRRASLCGRGVKKFCDFWHSSALYLGNCTR